MPQRHVHWLIPILLEQPMRQGAAAALAASRMLEKCENINACYLLEPIAVETVGVINTTAER